MGDKRLLVVDDEPQILELYVQAFQRAGYDVVAAPNAEQALAEMRRRFRPVVLTDLNMPGMNGLELCRRIRRDWPMTMVLAVTGYASLFEFSDCREAGFEDYFIKPVKLANLIAEVEQCFKKYDRWRGRLIAADPTRSPASPAEPVEPVEPVPKNPK